MALRTSVTTPPRERAVLVGVALRERDRSHVETSLDELALLADSAGARVVERLVQERSRIDPATFVGSGKVEELAWLVEERGAQLVVFDDDLSPVQVRNLERIVNRKIIDRSGVILDIFASRARTSEARTQVELAQLQYLLPRLTRQWTHLSKQYGGIGTKGPGETQIETDRRAIRTRISRLKEKLERIGREREVQRKGRERFPRVALVGYTNAGKSTVLNWFTGAGVLVEDRLFATLDSTVRLVTLARAHRVLLSDTVGFIRKLPHHLVASFRSTLAEAAEADLLLHVVDVSARNREEHMAVVRETLEEIGVHDRPAVTVFNKIDLLRDRSILAGLRKGHPGSVFVSAARSINMQALEEAIVRRLADLTTEKTLSVGVNDYPLIARIHEFADVLEQRYDGDTVTVRFRTNDVQAARLHRWMSRAKAGHRESVSAPKRKRMKGR
jgi:GTP-binding protein HflX